MEEGILEILLVNAKGIRYTNLIGKPAYYAIIQCGSEVRKSKKTSGVHRNLRTFTRTALFLLQTEPLNPAGYRHKAFWNEKFQFKLPHLEWKDSTHLQISIMNEKHFRTNGGFLGQSIVYIGGIIAEGREKGYIELDPAPYNVVLEDTTYKGEIKIGLKFSVNKDGSKERDDDHAIQFTGTRHNQMFTSFLKCLKMSWLSVFRPYGRTPGENGKRS